MSEQKKNTRHILGVSGGKDSAALAVHLRDRIPEMEYVFCDTGKELKETYEFIDKLEAFLNAHVVRVPKELPGFSDNHDFDHFIELYNGFLPSPVNRWCTKNLKLLPFEHFIGDDNVINYVGIRADEQRVLVGREHRRRAADALLARPDLAPEPGLRRRSCRDGDGARYHRAGRLQNLHRDLRADPTGSVWQQHHRGHR